MLEHHIIPVTAFAQNCTLLWCQQTRAAVLVDAGGEPERLLAAVAQRQLQLQALWVTHGHADHVGAVGDLAQRLQIPVIGPGIADDYWLQALPSITRQYGFPLAEVLRPQRWLQDGDQLELGEQTLTVIHCPGHTPGHMVFYSATARLALVGDVLFAGSIGRSDFPGGDGATLIRSIRERLFPLGDDVAFIPGHGAMSTLGEERRHNPFVADHLF